MNYYFQLLSNHSLKWLYSFRKKVLTRCILSGEAENSLANSVTSTEWSLNFAHWPDNAESFCWYVVNTWSVNEYSPPLFEMSVGEFSSCCIVSCMMIWNPTVSDGLTAFTSKFLIWTRLIPVHSVDDLTVALLFGEDGPKVLWLHKPIQVSLHSPETFFLFFSPRNHYFTELYYIQLKNYLITIKHHFTNCSSLNSAYIISTTVT